MYEYVARPIRSALKRRIDTVQPYYYEKQTDIDFSTEHETTTPDETGITFPEDNEGDGVNISYGFSTLLFYMFLKSLCDYRLGRVHVFRIFFRFLCIVSKYFDTQKKKYHCDITETSQWERVHELFWVFLFYHWF